MSYNHDDLAAQIDKAYGGRTDMARFTPRESDDPFFRDFDSRFDEMSKRVDRTFRFAGFVIIFFALLAAAVVGTGIYLAVTLL